LFSKNTNSPGITPEQVTAAAAAAADAAEAAAEASAHDYDGIEASQH
jgi:hypothetical protein